MLYRLSYLAEPGKSSATQIKDVRAGVTAPRTSCGPDTSAPGSAVKRGYEAKSPQCACYGTRIVSFRPGRMENISAALPSVIATAMFSYASS